MSKANIADGLLGRQVESSGGGVRGHENEIAADGNSADQRVRHLPRRDPSSAGRHQSQDRCQDHHSANQDGEIQALKISAAAALNRSSCRLFHSRGSR